MIKPEKVKRKYRNNITTSSTCNCGTCNCNCGAQAISTNIKEAINKLVD